MIIIDYSAIAMSNIFVLKQSKSFDENLIRHMILNSLRMYNKKFRNDYGEMVIACDGKGSWRREIYPHYKAIRRKNREEKSDFDWKEFFNIINKVREEIKENIPWKVIQINEAEADDIIATLVESTQEFGNHENVMIVSSDKDFIQLQKYKNVSQFSPSTKKIVKDKNPIKYLKEHIYRGDAGDGVPNILSPDNTFLDEIRQKPITKNRIEEWNSMTDFKNEMDTDTYLAYERNRKMIDLSCIPQEISDKILKQYKETKTKNNILNYFIEKRCRNLLDCISEFKPAK